VTCSREAGSGAPVAYRSGSSRPRARCDPRAIGSVVAVIASQILFVAVVTVDHGALARAGAHAG